MIFFSIAFKIGSRFGKGECAFIRKDTPHTRWKFFSEPVTYMPNSCDSGDLFNYISHGWWKKKLIKILAESHLAFGLGDKIDIALHADRPVLQASAPLAMGLTNYNHDNNSIRAWLVFFLTKKLNDFTESIHSQPNLQFSTCLRNHFHTWQASQAKKNTKKVPVSTKTKHSKYYSDP